MPHKRAKRSVRDTQNKETGFNNAPSGYRIDNEQLPKGAMRVLMGGQIQAAYRDKKKRKRGDSDKDGDKSKAEELKIRPGERLGDFHRRVDDSMRRDINSTIRSNTSEKAAKRMNKKLEEEASSKETKKLADKEKRDKKQREAAEAEAERAARAAQEEEEGQDSDGETMKPVKDFAAAERVRLNDVAQAPPSLPRMKRQAKRYGVEDSNAGSRVGAPLMRQMELEKERQRVINLYRAQKGKRLEDWVSSKEKGE
ncbi:hypothetical protein E3P99_02592 [Wallemia hederae]|uniref:Uncharacterized protein n=1 Tax=Wallemia hederae TaxID=1540922 RepID=A0A4T0FJG9_9BASI|nr:hypothetical protein E3P99_02592 [Wallemia hederae]